MHTLMSFIIMVALGTLMADTGLEPCTGAAFEGLTKMLSGKKYLQNVRALKMVAEEVLRGIITEKGLQTHSQIKKTPEDQSMKSQTIKLWVDNLIKPLLIVMLLVRAELKADWLLHLLHGNQDDDSIFLL